MKSFSEIETVSKRSSKAAGFSWGISEEVGKNIRLLEMFGLPGIKNLNGYLKKKKNEKFDNLILISNKNKKTNFKFCPISTGTNFLDQIKNLENLNEIKFENMGYPLLFLPFASRASEIIGKRLLLKLDNNQFLLNFNLTINTNFFKNEIIKESKSTSVSILENKDMFSEIEWKELYSLSEDTFVEENESLKKNAAGAGLNDND